MGKLPAFHAHPRFIRANVEHIRSGLAESLAPACGVHRSQRAACDGHNEPYVQQLKPTATLVAQQLGLMDWKLVYQSRSGPPLSPGWSPISTTTFGRFTKGTP